MQAYKTVLTLKEQNRLVLENLPFGKGQRVEVVVLATEEEAEANELKRLLAETQALPHLQSISEDDIAAEIASYRKNR